MLGSPPTHWTLLFALPLLLDLCLLGSVGTGIRAVQRSGRDQETLRPEEKRRHTEVQVPMASWVLCVALILAAVAGAVGETRYEKFLRQHVDHPRTLGLMGHRYCGIMLARRQVTAPGRPCKPSNTFVHAPAEDLVATCTRPADSRGFHSTSAPMDITACRLRGGDTRPPCNYRARQLHHHVRVSCLDGLPVHLAGTSESVNES